MKRELDVIIERDEDNFYVASVPQLPGCHTQAKTLDELIERVHETVGLYLEVNKIAIKNIRTKFVGIQKVEVNA